MGITKNGTSGIEIFHKIQHIMLSNLSIASHQPTLSRFCSIKHWNFFDKEKRINPGVLQSVYISEIIVGPTIDL